MSWWATGITAAMGAKRGLDNESKMKKNDQFRKAAITYSPWTQMADPGSPELSGALDSGLQGGVQGYMMGKSFNKPTVDPKLEIDMSTAKQGSAALDVDPKLAPSVIDTDKIDTMNPASQGEMMASNGQPGAWGGMLQQEGPEGSAGAMGMNPFGKKNVWQGMLG